MRICRPACPKASEPQGGEFSKDASMRRFLQKGSGRGSRPPRQGHSVLGPLSARPRRRGELKLVLSSAFGAESSATPVPACLQPTKAPKAISSQFIQKPQKSPARTPIDAQCTPGEPPSTAVHARYR